MARFIVQLEKHLLSHKRLNCREWIFQLLNFEVEEARDGLIEEKGFFMIPSELFCNVRVGAMIHGNLPEARIFGF